MRASRTCGSWPRWLQPQHKGAAPGGRACRARKVTGQSKEIVGRGRGKSSSYKPRANEAAVEATAAPTRPGPHSSQRSRPRPRQRPPLSGHSAALATRVAPKAAYKARLRQRARARQRPRRAGADQALPQLMSSRTSPVESGCPTTSTRGRARRGALELLWRRPPVASVAQPLLSRPPSWQLLVALGHELRGLGGGRGGARVTSASPEGLYNLKLAARPTTP